MKIVKHFIFLKKMSHGDMGMGRKSLSSPLLFCLNKFLGFVLAGFFTLVVQSQVVQTPLERKLSVKSCDCASKLISAEVEVSFDIPKRTIKAQSKLFLLPKQGADSVRFLLDKRFTVERLTDFDNKPLKMKRNGDVIAVRLKSVPLGIHSDTIGLIISYHGKPKISNMPPWESGFIWNTDTTSDFFIGVTTQLDSNSVWFPLCNPWSDKPESFTVSLVVPDTLLAISNGVMFENLIISEGKRKYIWNSVYPIVPYNVTFYIAKYSSFSDQIIVNQDTIRGEYFVRDENLDKARKHFKQVHQILDVYTRKFGSFPFPETGEKFIEVPYLGMEHQTAIAYGNRYMDGYLGFRTEPFEVPFDYVLMHELAHEWWGNSVTAQSTDHFWIQESLATFAESLVVEEFTGKEQSIAYITKDLKYSLLNRSPLCDTVNGSVYSRDLYHKGSAVWHTFRNLLKDDSLFFALLRGIQQEFRYGSVTTSELVNYINFFLSADYDWFFTRYIFQSSLPTMEIVPSCLDNRVLLYRWSESTGAFPLNLEVESGNARYSLVPDSSLKQIRLGIQPSELYDLIKKKYLIAIHPFSCMDFE